MPKESASSFGHCNCQLFQPRSPLQFFIRHMVSPCYSKYLAKTASMKHIQCFFVTFQVSLAYIAVGITTDWYICSLLDWLMALFLQIRFKRRNTEAALPILALTSVSASPYRDTVLPRYVKESTYSILC